MTTQDTLISQTEARYFPPPRRLCSYSDTLRLGALDNVWKAEGLSDFTTISKYKSSQVTNHQ
jgi:hypothetical protein